MLSKVLTKAGGVVNEMVGIRGHQELTKRSKLGTAALDIVRRLICVAPTGLPPGSPKFPAACVLGYGVSPLSEALVARDAGTWISCRIRHKYVLPTLNACAKSDPAPLVPSL